MQAVLWALGNLAVIAAVEVLVLTPFVFYMLGWEDM